MTAKVSREVFQNLASFRISPFLSADSARNSLHMGLIKQTLTNHSKHFVRRIGTDLLSDEALSRTYEALTDFRIHLCEQQVLRSTQKNLTLPIVAEITEELMLENLKV